jgi:hypothetical protein
MDYCISSVIGGQTIFRKRIPREKALLQKGFPPRPLFRKLSLIATNLKASKRFAPPHTNRRRTSSGAGCAPEASTPSHLARKNRAFRTRCRVKETIHLSAISFSHDSQTDNPQAVNAKKIPLLDSRWEIFRHLGQKLSHRAPRAEVLTT